MIKKLLSSFFITCLLHPALGQFNWQHMNTVYPATAANATINYSIADQQVVWACHWNDQGKVAFTKTTDGGATWQAVPNLQNYSDQFFAVSDLHAVSENLAYMGTRYQLNTGKGRLYKTQNGGQSWTVIKEFQTILTYVHFWDANTGIVVCYPDNNPNGSKKIEIFRTADGGATWVAKGGALITASKPNQIPRYIHDDLGDSFWFGSSEGEMIRTNDRGVTWTVTQTLYDSSHYEFGAKSLGHFQITGANSAIYTNYNDGKLYKTTDGFATEQYVGNPGFGQQTYLEKIPNTDILLATGASYGPNSSRGSRYSTDGGVTWHLISNVGRAFPRSAGLNMTIAHGWDGTGGNDDYWRIVKLGGGLPTSPGTPGTPGTPGAPGTPGQPGTGPAQPPTTPEEFHFGIYPVPTLDYLYFNSERDPIDFTVWDSAGRLILTGNTVEGKLDVSYFQKGVYHIKVRHEGQDYTKKFIKR